MKVMLYVQNTYGTGHLKTALNLASALDDVTLVYGGPKVPYLIPENVQFNQLPTLVDDESRKGLKTDTYSLDYVKKSRAQMLLSIYKHYRPDVLITEHFPFGRANFVFELLPLLKFAKCKIYSSFRGILGQDLPTDFSKFIEFYDGFFVHTDPEVSRFEEQIPIEKLIYTGFVTPRPKKEPCTKVLVHAGSGRDSEEFLNVAKSVIDKQGLDATIYSGLYGDNFKPDITGQLLSAEITITTAGYNSAAETLLTDAKSILVPINKEQELRTKDFEKSGLAISLPNITEEALASAIKKKIPDKPKVRIDGAEFVRDYLK